MGLKGVLRGPDVHKLKSAMVISELHSSPTELWLSIHLPCTVSPLSFNPEDQICRASEQLLLKPSKLLHSSSKVLLSMIPALCWDLRLQVHAGDQLVQ